MVATSITWTCTGPTHWHWTRTSMLMSVTNVVISHTSLVCHLPASSRGMAARSVPSPWSLPRCEPAFYSWKASFPLRCCIRTGPCIVLAGPGLSMLAASHLSLAPLLPWSRLRWSRSVSTKCGMKLSVCKIDKQIQCCLAVCSTLTYCMQIVVLVISVWNCLTWRWSWLASEVSWHSSLWSFWTFLELSKHVTLLVSGTFKQTSHIDDDSTLSFDEHVTDVARQCYYHVRALKHIRPLLALEASKTFAVSIVGSKLDYCNCALDGIF